MKFSTLRIWLLGSVVVVFCGCDKRQPEPKAFDTEPIITIGHGAFVGIDGEEFVPDETFIRRTQAYYIEKALGGNEEDNETRRARSLVYELVDDRIYANALFIDWLLEHRKPANLGHIANVNHALRWHYFLSIQRKKVPEDRRRWDKGVGDEETAGELEEAGFVVYAITTNSGEAYVAECRDAGVPVPNAMFSDEWVFKGTFDKEFISAGSKPELYLYESDAPAGVCLALPRYPGKAPGTENDAGLLGIICLGTQSNKSCFFDNPNGTTFARDVEVSINRFVGGTALVANGQGECTDCHAGENPYIVHPEKAAFSGLAPLPSGWPDPLVDASWPQNAGPTNLLDAVSSTRRCDACHRLGLAGRFPEFSTEVPDYCATILGNATHEAMGTGTTAPDASKRTMPPFGGNKSDYMDHINAIKAACRNPPSGGGVVVDVDLEDDPDFISNPIVIDPLYSCTERVSVRSTILDAKVTLFVNGTAIDPPIESRNPDLIEFDVPALETGDRVFARQEVDAAFAESATITVKNWLDDYPGGVPTPSVDPVLIHQCAGVISARHIGGAKVTVFSNSADPVTYTTGSYGWTLMRPFKQPFDIGDQFSVKASMCNIDGTIAESGTSNPAEAVAVVAPAPLPTAGLVPSTTFAGQELIDINNLAHGAISSIEEVTIGPAGNFETSISWQPGYDVATAIGRPLAAGDTLSLSQELCAAGPVFTGEAAVGCAELPAPLIEHPIVGQERVVVTRAVPGARIRVYDESGEELGDGSGTNIILKRPITGADILTVTQQVGECMSRSGYRVSVRNAEGQQPDDG
jgi:hypothetical protein